MAEMEFSDGSPRAPESEIKAAPAVEATAEAPQPPTDFKAVIKEAKAQLKKADSQVKIATKSGAKLAAEVESGFKREKVSESKLTPQKPSRIQKLATSLKNVVKFLLKKISKKFDKSTSSTPPVTTQGSTSSTRVQAKASARAPQALTTEIKSSSNVSLADIGNLSRPYSTSTGAAESKTRSP